MTTANTKKTRYILSFDAGGTFLKSGIFKYDGKLELVENSKLQEPVNSNGTKEQVYTAYINLLKANKAFADNAGFAFDCVSVDTPGPFDYEGGMSMMTHKYTAIYQIPLRPWFAEVLGDIPVYFMHDSFAFIYGAAQESENSKGRIAGVMIGTGLGFALLIDGKVQKSETGGPARSIYRAPYGESTAEDHVSARGLVYRYNRDKLPTDPDCANAKEISERASEGNATAIKVYKDTGVIVADVVKDILAEYEIEEFIYGGQISKSFYLFEDSATEALKGVPTLKTVRAAKNIDDVHLIGSAAGILSTFED
ncbi:MAG: ROK family protein [Clostridia bacterium]|nr:ROK family protein [Clostridia bacterium]